MWFESHPADWLNSRLKNIGYNRLQTSGYLTKLILVGSTVFGWQHGIWLLRIDGSKVATLQDVACRREAEAILS